MDRPDNRFPVSAPPADTSNGAAFIRAVTALLVRDQNISLDAGLVARERAFDLQSVQDPGLLMLIGVCEPASQRSLAALDQALQNFPSSSYPKFKVLDILDKHFQKPDPLIEKPYYHTLAAIIAYRLGRIDETKRHLAAIDFKPVTNDDLMSRGFFNRLPSFAVYLWAYLDYVNVPPSPRFFHITKITG